jgi:antibiotic biosynthesis monooxygenase (ABM) superfamily enzyme
MTDLTPDTPAGVSVTCHVAAVHVPAFEDALHELLRVGAEQPGHVSVEVLRGVVGPAGRDYHVIYRFADTASLMAWEGSAAWQTLLHRLAPLMAETARQKLTGMEAWFDIPAGAAPPSRNRMAVVTWIGIWPLVSLALLLVAPALADLPFLVRTGVTAALVVLAMTYVVMPRLARLADPWLRGGR